MSNKFSEPWSLQEKIELLINILQVQHQHLHRDFVGFLAQSVRQNQLLPWNEVPLPSGRSLLSCQAICDALNATSRLQQPFGPANPPQPGAAYAGPPPAQSQTPSHHQQQPPPQQQQQQQQQQQPTPRTYPAVFDGEQPAWIHQQHPRAIQPRPSRSTDSPNPVSTNGESLTIMRTTGPEMTGEKRRKKRGRPTKEEAEERDRQLAAEGKVYEPKKRPTKKFRASTGTPGPASEAALSPVARQTTPVPRAPPAATEESSSSGKRRSKRQASFARGQPVSPTRRGPDPSDSTGAESPSDRLFAHFGERDRLPPHGHASNSPGHPSAPEEAGPSAG